MTLTCRTCGHDSARIVYRKGKDHCPHCSGISEAGGTGSGVLTRMRVRQDAMMHEGNNIHPFAWDKQTHQIAPNEEFLKLYPHKAKSYFHDEELVKANRPDLVTHDFIGEEHYEEPESVGETEDAIAEILKES